MQAALKRLVIFKSVYCAVAFIEFFAINIFDIADFLLLVLHVDINKIFG